MLGELLQLRRARRHFGLEAVALAGNAAGLGLEGAIESRRLAEVHEQRQQAERGHRRDADAIEHQRLVHALPADLDLLGLVAEQLFAERAHQLHFFAADVGEHELAPAVPDTAVMQIERGG